MKNLRFLSETDLSDKELLLEVCRRSLHSIADQDDRAVLENLLGELSAGDWALITPQEVHFLRGCGEGKWADYLVYRWKFKNYGRMKKVPAFPLYLLVEPSSICNLRCTMCFQADKSFSANKEYLGNMGLDLFKRVVDQAVDGGTKALTMASRGEPTIHPQFGEMLEYCAGKFYELKINTNALLLDSDLAHQILRSGVGIVVFSVDAYDSAGYREIRQSDKFDAVVQNIRHFNDVRRGQYPDSATVARVHGVKVDEGFDEKRFYKFWRGVADEVSLSQAVTRWDTYNNEKTGKRTPCPILFDRMYVWFDGTCNPCDNDYKSYLAVGNANDQTLAEIWHGSKFEALRKTHLERNRPTLVPCDRCVL